MLAEWILGKEGNGEETIDAAIDCCSQLVWYHVPLVVAFNIEEVALVVGIGLRLIEVSILSDVLLHIAMGIQTVVAL